LTKLRKDYENGQAELIEKSRALEEITNEVNILRAKEKNLIEEAAAAKSQFEEFKVESGIFARRTQNVLGKC